MKKFLIFFLFVFGTLFSFGVKGAEALISNFQQGVGGYTGNEATYIHSWYPDTNYNAQDRLLVYTGSSQALIKYDLASLPTNIRVTRATLDLYVADRGGLGAAPLPVSIYKLKRNWIANQANWFQASNNESWSLAGANDGYLDRELNTVSSQTITEIRRTYSFDITSLAQEWINYPQTNKGVVVISNPTGAGVGYVIADENYPAIQFRPTLFLEYSISADNDFLPYLEFQAPFHEQFISGVKQLAVNTSDDRGISRVEYYLDGSLISSSVTSPYFVDLDTARYSMGKHILKAKAIDSGGQSKETSILVYFYKTNGNILTIAHLTDTHLGSCTVGEDPVTKSYYPQRLRTVIDDLNRIVKPAAIITTGDIVSAPGVSNYRIYNDIISQSLIPVKTIPGNHDLTDGGKVFRGSIGQLKTSFDIEQYRFVGYAVNGSGSYSSYGNWISSLLMDKVGRGIIFSHYPIDLLPEFAGKPLYQMSSLEKTMLQNVISNYGVPLYLSGHVHEHFIIEEAQTKVLNFSALSTTQKSAYEVITIDNGVISNGVNSIIGNNKWPFIVITYPQQYYGRDENKKISGQTTIRAKIFDDKTINSVSYRIDGGSLVMMENKGAGIWEKDWDSLTTSNGIHKITVFAVDTDNRGKETTISVKVDNQATITPTPTAVPTPTTLPTPTFLPTPTPTPTPTIMPSLTPSPSPTPPSGGCVSKVISQETGNLKQNINNEWEVFINFVSLYSGNVTKISLKAGNWGNAQRSIFCKVTDDSGSKNISVEKTSNLFTSSSGDSWRDLDYRLSSFYLNQGTNYRLYCKGPDSWGSLYWIYSQQGVPGSKTYKISICQSP